MAARHPGNRHDDLRLNRSGTSDEGGGSSGKPTPSYGGIGYHFAGARGRPRQGPVDRGSGEPASAESARGPAAGPEQRRPAAARFGSRGAIAARRLTACLDLPTSRKAALVRRFLPWLPVHAGHGSISRESVIGHRLAGLVALSLPRAAFAQDQSCLWGADDILCQADRLMRELQQGHAGDRSLLGDERIFNPDAGSLADGFARE
jgi:hypothetical protein